jgi:hypothetical protein
MSPQFDMRCSSSVASRRDNQVCNAGFVGEFNTDPVSAKENKQGEP